MTDSPRHAPLLLVDDNADDLELLGRAVKKCGFDAVRCSSGQQAMEILDGWNSGIVLADLHMPGMDGLSLCRILRSQGRPWSPYFILLTGDEKPSLIEDAFEQGVDDFLVKPVSPIELKCRLRAATRLADQALDLRDRCEADLERRMHQAGMGELREVVATLAHDLRTPIGALRATAEMLVWRSAELPEKVAQGLERMVALAIHLSETVTDVADAFVCEDLDQLREAWTEFDLSAECARACDLIHAKVGPGIPLVPPPMLPRIAMRGSAPGIRRLILNIVSNALRATTHGEVRIEVEAGSDPHFAHIVVRDTGGGIPVEILPHLGEPLMLSSGSNLRKRAVHGAGMGLSICRRLAALHGGRILISTRPGIGTTVRVQLRQNLSEPCLDKDYCKLDTEVLS